MQNKKNILLVNPSSKFQGGSNVAIKRNEPPIALLNIASFLDSKGYKCDIIDTVLESEPRKAILQRIKNRDYLFVGFSVFVGIFLKNAKELSALIKEFKPDLPIVWGGVEPSIAPGEVLQTYKVDFVVRYEGEYTLFELANALNNGSGFENIDGLSFVKDGEIVHNKPRHLETNLDKFPVPKWELFGEKCNSEQTPYFFRIMSSKGCPFQCTFCYNRSVEESIQKGSPPWRARSAEHVIGEIEHIHRLTGTRVFTLGDDNFLIDKNRAIKIFRYFRRNGFYAEQCIAHLNNLNDEIIGEMAGIVQTLIYAIEATTPKLITLLKKNIDLQKIPPMNKKLYENGITTAHNIIIGLPTEDDSDLRANVELMLELKEINPYVRCAVYIFLPLPQTPLLYFTEKEYNVKISQSLPDFEDAAIDSGIATKKLRPWMSDEKFQFLTDYCTIFGSAFRMNNPDLSPEAKELLEKNERLRKLFKGVEKVNHPKGNYKPYVLDRVLRGEKIDLVNDLRNH